MLVSLIILLGCLGLLSATRRPVVAAGTFAVTRALLAMMLGRSLVSAIVWTAVYGAVAFVYFWILDRVHGSWLWWVVLAAGIVLIL
jgi:hypothetical protein